MHWRGNEDEIRETPGEGADAKEQALSVALFCLFPAAAFYLMEAYEHNAFVEVRPLAQLFNILLFELIAWALYLLFGGMRLAIRTLLVVATVFGLANHYVVLFRSTPLVPWDLFSIGTAATVAGNYDFTPGARVVFVTLGFVALFALAHFMKKAPRIRPLPRLSAAALVVLALCVFTNTLQDEDFQIENYLYPYLFTPGYMTKVNGMAVTFAIDLQYLNVDQPKGYDEEEAAELLASYEGEDEPTAADYPNIIVVMDEAFSDLAVLGDLETNVDYMPFYHELQRGAENTVTGYVQVSVCGGNTANSEFEFLTGSTMAFLPEGSIPYQQYVEGETESLASHLASLGYQTCAQHPYYGSGWERERVYPLFGFADLDFIDDYTDRRYVRKYISDACDFAHVIKTFEEKENGPLFLFNVTMQNHGGYTEEYDDFASDVQANGGSAALNQYLSLIRLSDENLEGLVAYFSGVEEPTVLVFFGDHQPSDSVVRPVWTANGVDSAHLTEEQQRLRYQVPYLIWANFDIEEGTGIDTSLNYLACHVLDLAGVPKSAYQNYLNGLENVCPVISAAGQTCAAGTGEEELEAALLTYQRLQYYQLFDGGNDEH